MPREEYARRLAERRAAVAAYDRKHLTLGNWRLGLGVAAAVLVYLAFGRGAVSGWWLLAPVAAFACLAVVHDRVLRERRLRERAVRFYEHALARLEDRWAGTGETGERFLNPAHPYAEDLDLFGRGSLFELICTARTRMGEFTLASWLLGAAAPQAVRARQEAVEELRPRLDLREDLAVLGEDVRTGVHPELLAAWGEQPPLLDAQQLRPLAIVLSALGISSLIGLAIIGIADLSAFALPETASIALRDYFLAVLVLDALFFFRYRKAVAHVVHAVEDSAHDLALLSAVLVRIERERFSSPLLSGLRADLDTEGWPPSRRIARLNRLMELLDSRDNLALRVIGPILLWDTHVALAVEAWRKKSGAVVRRWLEAVGAVEALSCLAGYSFEHPADVFAEFAGESPWLDAQEIGHPLIPESRAVCNSVRLGGDLRVLVVSGSNMSGKSTLLRTVGINVVLAQAGAPVRARALRLSPLAVGASIHILDSLQTGTSRFYAEVTRLRRIMDLTNGLLPVLFLLDEFLHGTNSHDRFIGAEAIVRGLADRGAIGFVTTHDLALAEIADGLGERGSNVHFQDYLEDGLMRFDYRMRPGIVRKSNALELMRSVGLEV